MWKQYAYKSLLIISLIALWEAVAKSNVFSSLAFPTVEKIITSLAYEIKSGDILKQTYNSLKLIFEGIGIALLLTAIMGTLGMWLPSLNTLYNTLISIIDPLPGIALLPLAILWFGIGNGAIIFIIVDSVLWPVLLNIIVGFKTIPKCYKEISANIGLKGIAMLTKIMLPATLPDIITGLKVGWSRAWRALISAEMIFGASSQGGGMGWYIYQKRFMMDIPAVFAGLIIIIIIGILVEDVLFTILEKNTIQKWGMTS